MGYESIMTGLNEALEDAKSEKPVLKRNTVTIEPVNNSEIEEDIKNPSSPYGKEGISDSARF